ncbi:MAG: hypothetical protein H7Y60_12325, partial [Rhodospirillaceae bacterium]|nr:hypothetical protein [Rhodospirillales bacterium]
MGQAKRRKAATAAGNPWPQDTSFRGNIEFHTLPPVESITTDRIMELSGDRSLPSGKQVNLTVYRAVVGDRTF